VATTTAPRGPSLVFSNEIAALDGPAEPGATVEIIAANGQRLGTGYYNPHSLIAARLLTRRHESIDTSEFFVTALQKALEYRRRLGGDLEALRLIHGESDALPGLVVDRYGDAAVCAIADQGDGRAAGVARRGAARTPGATCHRRPQRQCRPRVGGLPRGVELLHGEVPEPVVVTINGLRFAVDVLAGQKTGLFLDQSENCRRLHGLAQGSEVLDLFCYAGAWSVHAASYGANSVTGVDCLGGGRASGRGQRATERPC